MNYILFILKSAAFDFSRNKLRTALTSLGILIGVSSVVLLLAFGLGLRIYIGEQFESLGSNLVYVMPGTFGGSGGIGFRPGAFGSVRFDEKDLSQLKKIKETRAVVGAFARTSDVSAGGETQTVDVFAATPEIFPVRNFELAFGRFYDDADIDKRAKVAVLGPKIAQELFGEEQEAIGKSIKIEGQGYAVVGTLVSKGGGGFGAPDFDSFVYVPFTSAAQFNPNKEFIAFYLQADSEESIATVREKAQETLEKRYKDDKFSVVEQTEIISTVTSIFQVLNSILVAIGAISLIVGGVGIMNIMYVTVTERIKEIGVRRAIGATSKDILLQFLTEAIILSLLGGALGLLFAFVVVFFVQQVFPATISLLSVGIALIVSSAIGIVFGVFPAKKAADLSPIDAIRYE